MALTHLVIIVGIIVTIHTRGLLLLLLLYASIVVQQQIDATTQPLQIIMLLCVYCGFV